MASLKSSALCASIMIQLALVTPGVFAEDSSLGSVASSNPNFLIVVGDDIGWPYYGFMGDPHVQTPNLDQLSQEGTWFPVAYTTSSLCRPSNPSIASGLYNFQTPSIGKTPDPETPTLANQLATAGYRSFAGGKWPTVPGREHAHEAGWEVLAEEFARPGEMSCACEGPHSFARDASSSQALTGFLDDYGSEPWIAWVAPYTTHVPYQPNAQFQIYDTGKKKANQFYATVSQLDDWIGWVRSELEARGELDNTVIIYLSDNGAGPGDPKLKPSKSKHSEGGYRTPIILWGGASTRLEGSGKRLEFAHAVDIFPTILGLAGIPLPEGPEYHGQRLDRVGEVPWREVLVGQHARKFASRSNARHARDERYFMTAKGCPKKLVFFDLEANPYSPPKIRSADLDAERAATLASAVDQWWDPCAATDDANS